MEFLMKIIPENEDGDDDEDQSCEKDAGETSFNTSVCKIKYEEATDHTEQNLNKKTQNQPVEIEVNCTPVDDRDATDMARVMNEDEAFFASLLPTVVRYDEQERLEFRIKVLGAMKKIIDKRQGVFV